MKKLSPPSLSPQAAPQSSEPPLSRKPKARRELLEERALSLLLKFPPFISLVNEDLLFIFSCNKAAVLFAFWNGKKKTAAARDKILKDITAKNTYFAEALNSCLLQAESNTEQDPQAELQLCLEELREMERKRILEAVALEIRQAEKAGQSDKLRLLITKFNKLAKSPV